tara:strand:- start:2231 stop:3193 length:963 start_codon:yes stop_codon:yes gene_type:complete
MSTFVDLYTDLLNLGGQDATGEALQMAKTAVNRAYRRVLGLSGQVSSQREFSLSVASGTSQYGCGPYVKRILNIDDGTNDRQVTQITKGDYDGLYPGTSATGDPRYYYILGSFGVNAQPSSASTLSFTSNDNDDNGTVRVSGFVSGVYTHESITLNGTSAVATSNSYTTVERVTKLQADTTTHDGTVTATSNSGAVTVVVIPYHMDSPTHLWVEFYPTPDSSLTYTIRAEMNKPNMINDGDWPDIDEDFHNAILYIAAGEVLPAFGNESLGARMLEEGKDELDALLGTRVSRNILRQFVDVTTNVGVGPQRPLVQGIDIN